MSSNSLFCSWITAFAILIAGPAIAGPAGPNDGGGGNAVVCHNPDGSISKVTLLDYTTSWYRDQIDLGNAPDWHQRLEVAMSRIEKRDPRLATELRDRVKQFDQTTYFAKDSDLRPLPYDDSKYITIPHCADGKSADIFQLAIQTDGRLPGEPLYTVNDDLWAKMDATQRAGLVLHEVLYRKARENGALDSQGPQYMNALAATPNGLAALTDQQYFQLQANGYLFVYAYGDGNSRIFIVRYYGLDVRDYDFYPSGALKSAESASGFINIRGATYPVEIGSSVLFYETGQLKENSGLIGSFDLQIMVNGQLKQVKVHPGDPNHTSENSGDVSSTWTAKITFTKDGFATQGALDTPLLVNGVSYGYLSVDENTKQPLTAAVDIKFHGWVDTNHPTLKRLYLGQPDSNHQAYCNKTYPKDSSFATSFMTAVVWPVTPDFKVDLIKLMKEEPDAQIWPAFVDGNYFYCGIKIKKQ